VTDTIPFERYRGGHLITLPARIGGTVPTRMVLDTGIGINLVAADLCEREGWRPTGESYSGRRMSGQRLTAPLTRVPSISIGTVRKENVPAAIVDLTKFLPPNSGVSGLLAPSFFEPWPFAVNSVSQTVRVIRGDSVRARPGVAVEAPLEVRRTGPGVDLFTDLRLPSGSSARVEVDTGTDALILHTRYMKELGVDPDRSSVRTERGTDETGAPYTRYFAQIQGTVSMDAAPRVVQHDPTVLFQQIIYDGLLGDAFLRTYDVTYDLSGGRLLFADPTL
jgi:hypothetical protein